MTSRVLDWLQRRADVLFGILVLLVLGLLATLVVAPSFEKRLAPIGGMVQALAAVLYVWLTYGLVRQAAGSVEAMREGNAASRAQVDQMQRARRDAVKPEVIADHGRGEQLRPYFFTLRNHGNGIARNIVVTVRGSPVAKGVTSAEPVIGRRALLTQGQPNQMTVEADLTPYAQDRHFSEYQVVAMYMDALGNSLESVTVFGKDHQHGELPIGPVSHEVRYV